MSNCNKCYKKACQCGQLDIDFVKQLAAPTFTEDLYKFATENGLFEGSVGEFLIFMKGPQGDSIYEWSVKNGYTSLSKEEWYNQVIGTLQYSEDEW